MYYYLLSFPFSLLSDIDKIHAGIGDKFAILIQWIATFFAGFVIGFVREWRMTLFLIAVTPFLAIVTAIFSKVYKISLMHLRVYYSALYNYR